MAEAGLARALPLRTAVSTSAGLASAAINFLACVEIAEYAGGGRAWLAIVVAGILIVLAGLNFSELTGLYPTSAALRVWVRRGLGDRVSMVTSLVYVTTVVFVMAADGFVLAEAFQSAVPAVPGIVWVGLLLAAVVWANLRGIRVAGAVQDANALLLLGTLTVFSLVVILRHHPVVSLSLPAASHGAAGWLQAVALGVFIYVGFEWVTPLAEEFQDARVIPRGMFIALGLIAVAFGLFTAALTDVFPQGAGLKASVVPQLLVGLKALGPVGFWWMVLITGTTAVTTFNGGLVTASRFLYALARERVLPRRMAGLNRHLVPAAALYALAGTALILAVAVYVSGRYEFLINVGAGVESVMYAVAAVLVISLRRREPSAPRPFRVIGVPAVPAVSIVIFLGLGAAALTTPVGASRVPWPLIFVSALSVLAVGYVWWVVPRLRTGRVSVRGQDVSGTE